MVKMEDLLVKLQDYEQHLQDLKAQESYLAEKYKSILKPWPIKCEAEPPPKNEEEEAATTSSNGLKEVEKMLEKARVVRSKHSAPRTKSAPKCKDCVKGNCSKHKSLKTIKSKSMTTSTSAKTEVGSKPNIKTEAKPTKSETFLPKRQQNYKYVNFEEVLQENPIPQKILKLRAMHEKLRANEVFDSMFMEQPCEAEKRFISKLRGCGGSTDNDILTSVAVNNKIEECVAVAERLIEALSAFKEPEFGVDLKFMYHRKSLLAHAQALVEDLDKMFSYIHKVEVIDFGESENIPQMELDEISSFHQYFVYNHRNEVAKFTAARHDRKWLDVQIAIKEMLQKRVFPILENPDIESDELLTILPQAHGLLMKRNRCAINPSLVYDDSED